MARKSAGSSKSKAKSKTKAKARPAKAASASKGGSKASRSKATAAKAAGARKATRRATPAKAKATRRSSTAAKAAGTKAAAVRPSSRRKTIRKTIRKSTRKGAAAPAVTTPGEDVVVPEIKALAQLMDDHGLVDVHYKVKADGTKDIRISRVGASAPAGAPAPVAAAAPAPAPAAPAPAPAAAAPAEAPPPAAPEEDLIPFKSPMVGTFYRAPSPEAPPFASVGDSIDPGAVVCIIEAMKVMNEINPDVQGEVVSIEVENGEAVEFGQTLMLVRSR